MCGIYKITNLINQHSYIGQSKNIDKRWSAHRSRSQNPASADYNCPLYCAFRKYGIDNFSFSVLEECSVELLNKREQYWIQYYNTFMDGYNQTLGGDTTSIVNKSSIVGIINDLQNTDDYHRDIAQRWGVSIEMVQGINTGRYWHQDIEYPIQKRCKELQLKPKQEYVCIVCGKPISHGCQRCVECENEERRRLSKKPTSEELLLKIEENSGNFSAVAKLYEVSSTSIRRWLESYNLSSFAKDYKKQPISEKQSIEQKPIIIQYDLKTGDIINTFLTIADAAHSLGKTTKESSHISAVCHNKRKSAYGFGWRFGTNI